MLRMTDQAVVDRYNAQAEQHGSKQYPAIDLVRLERWYFEGKFGRVLDYGCGPGVSTIHLAQRGYTVDAVDAAEEICKIARERIAKAPGIEGRATVHHLPANATSIPFDDGIFDYVVCVNVLSLLASRERVSQALGEFRRVLKPGGKIIVDVNAAHADFARNSTEVEPDVYLFKGRDGEETGIRTYCPKDGDSFAELVAEHFTVDDVGYTSFKYLHSTITEFIVCAHK